jgi:integrase/recombinase XerD
MILFKRNGFFHVEYFDDSAQKLRRKSLKTKNRSEALAKLTDFKKSLVQCQRPHECTLSKFKVEYEKFIRENYSKKYLESVEFSFKMLIEYLENNICLSELNNLMMEKFLLHVFNRSKYSAHQYCRTLKAAFNKAITWKYINNNPFVGIKLPKIATKHPVFISEKEMDIIIDNINEKDVQDIITIAFFTGMRLSEILNLCWSAIDFTSDIISVQNNETFTTKSKHERIIPMHSKVRSVLNNRGHNDSSVYVFSKREGCLYSKDFVSNKFKKAIRQSKLSEELHFHSLRHSFASNLVQKGVSLYVVKELLGHESITTTQIYSHLQNESLINAIAVL